jgi:hypothetical protein
LSFFLNASIFVIPDSFYPGNYFRNHGDVAHERILKYVEDYGDELMSGGEKLVQTSMF